MSTDEIDKIDERAELNEIDGIDETVRRWRTRGWTTIVLKERDDGEWLATQGGVPVEGRGETAALAAADYCRSVEGMNR